MRIYFIKKPYVSKGLKRSYCKQLEVYSGETREDRDAVHSDSVFKYHPGRNEWIERANNGQEYVRIYNKEQIFSTMPPLNKMHSTSAFTTLEMAQAAKLMLIQKMAKQYEDELDRLKELFSRNVPDVNKPLKPLKEEYPEYFI